LQRKASLSEQYLAEKLNYGITVDVYGRLRKLSPAAPEYRSGIVGELLQRLCKVAPKPPEKVY